LRLFGPTGGYLLGFGLAMSYLAKTRNSRRGVPLALKLLVACIIYFACGLLQLSVFLPLDKLLFAGLYPFIIGDLIKMTFVWFFIKKINEIKG
jgi:biotin transporter BioY